MGMLYNNDINIYPLKEVYYGKPKEFDKVEKLLEKLIYTMKKLYHLGGKIDINKTAELIELEKIFKNYFKVKEFHLSFYTIPIPSLMNNAFSLPTYATYFHRDPNNKKMADPTKLIVNVSIDIGFVIHNELNSKELLAFILHEIGHAFDASPVMLLSSYAELLSEFLLNTPLDNVMAIIGTIYGASKKNSNAINKFTKASTTLTSKFDTGYTYMLDIEKYIKTIRQTVNSYRFFKYIKDIKEIKYLKNITDIKRIRSVSNKFSFDIIHLFKQLGKDIPLNSEDVKFFYNFGFAIRKLKNFISPKGLMGYGGEKFSDSFATTYGYGEYLSTGLAKIDKNKINIINDIAEYVPVLALGTDLVQTSIDLVTSLADPHPKSAARINNQINKLKRDVNDPNLSPSIKKEINEQIKSMEDTLKKYYTSTDVAKRGKVLTFVYNYILINVFKGKMDPRELIHGSRREM